MAVYGIMRVEKRTTAACGGLQAEHERTEKDSNKHFDRSDIDWQRTAHNEHSKQRSRQRGRDDGMEIGD